MKESRKQNNAALPKEELREKLYYLKRSIFHLFDGFYEIRFRRKGSTLLAVALLLIFGVLRCVEHQYTGFIMNTNELQAMNSVSIFSTTVLVLVLFAVSNWTVTTLLNGSGNLPAIVTVLGYSLIPYMTGMIVKVFASNFIILEEAMILNVIESLGLVWSVFMLVAGLLTIHEYTFGKNAAAILLTFVAAVIIVFIGMLFFTLIEQMVSFIVSVAQEMLRRM